ncbi:MAG: hypothetical protein ACUZ8H_05500 [Candidatus Anammoxibacter sp.]
MTIYYTFKNLHTQECREIRVERAEFQNVYKGIKSPADLFRESSYAINEAGYKRQSGHRWSAEQGSTFVDDDTGEHIQMFRNKKSTAKFRRKSIESIIFNDTHY